MGLQLLELCSISPPSGSVSTTSLPLTLFDLPWLLCPPVQRIFLYEVDVSKTHFMDSVLPNLKQSLSLTLQHFYPFAGNLTWPPHSALPQILYTGGDSVALTVTESDQTFYLLTGNHSRNAVELYHLAPNFGPLKPTDKSVPLMCLKVTLFPNKGICIGITVNHAVADGRTANLFMKSWASACRLGDDVSSMTPSYNRKTVEEHRKIEQTMLKRLEKCNITKAAFNCSILRSHSIDKVLATFVMTRPDLIRLKQWVMSKKQVPEGLRLSTFVLTCAYVWACVVKARMNREDDTKVSKDQKEHFGFAVDCRDQLSPPLPKTYFGNCFMLCGASVRRNELIQEGGVATAAVVIAKAIQDTRNSSWRYIETCFNRFDDIDMENLLSVAGSPKFAVYDTDFGWGKPRKVEVVSVGKARAISISECPDHEGAIEVGLLLSNKEMDVFASEFVNKIDSLDMP